MFCVKLVFGLLCWLVCVGVGVWFFCVVFCFLFVMC